jgi:hypothetical protein
MMEDILLSLEKYFFPTIDLDQSSFEFEATILCVSPIPSALLPPHLQWSLMRRVTEDILEITFKHHTT